MLNGFRIAAVCMSRIHEDVLREFLEDFSRALKEHGWRCLVYATGSTLYNHTASDSGEAAVFDLIDTDIVDATVIFGDKVLDKDCVDRIVVRMKANNIPTLMINSEHEDCCCLNFDFEHGFEAVVRHVVEEHGIRDIHFIAGMKDNSFSDTRIEVVRKVLAENGIPFTDKDLSYGDFWSIHAREAVKKLIAENRLPRAIICANDNMALAVNAELQQNGYRIPEDVIVTGFDGIDDIFYCVPKTTSAACDYRELGRRAAELCIGTAECKSLPKSVLIVPKLIPQESCGCMAKKDTDMLDILTRKNDAFYRYQTEMENLSEIGAEIQSCTTLTEVSKRLHHELFYCMQCFLKKECTDFSLDPMMQHSATAFGEEMYVLLDSDWHESEGNLVPRKQIAQRLDVLFASGEPVIFTALHNISLPIGYICYSFQDCDYPNYIKINQNTMTIGPAIQGFRNRHYQEHLQAVVEASYKYDSLTGLLGRSAFLKRLGQIMNEENHENLTLVLVDLDGLKYINDHFSHSEGDNAIFTAAEALQMVCRELSCRYGGDELVALLTHKADPDKIKADIYSYLDNYNSSSGKPYEVSASVGVYSSSGESFEMMFEKADALMYKDKSGKPNRRK